MRALLAVGVLAMLLVGCSARAWEADCDVPDYEVGEYWAAAEEAGEADPDGNEWRCILLALGNDAEWGGEEWREVMGEASHIERRQGTQFLAMFEDANSKMVDAADWPAAVKIRDEFVERLWDMLLGDLDLDDEQQDVIH